MPLKPYTSPNAAPLISGLFYACEKFYSRFLETKGNKTPHRSANQFIISPTYGTIEEPAYRSGRQNTLLWEQMEQTGNKIAPNQSANKLIIALVNSILCYAQSANKLIITSANHQLTLCGKLRRTIPLLFRYFVRRSLDSAL